MATVTSPFAHVPQEVYNNILSQVPASDRAKPFTVFEGTTSFKPTGGNDFLVLSPGSKLPKITGTPKGFDVVQTSRSVDLDDSGFRGAVLTGNSNIRAKGSDFGDAIIGNDGRNTISSGAGKDVVSGGGGSDRIFGDSGNDTVFGDSGNDRLFGGTGNDVAKGGVGNDQLSGDAGRDRLYGDEGNDLLRGGDAKDTIYGGDGNDRLFGDAGSDRLYGDAGNDKLYGGEGGDRLDGGAGNDLLHGLVGDDRLFGGDDRDTLLGGQGDDTLWGGLGSDRLHGGAGDDTFTIEKGNVGDVDVISDFNPQDDVIDLSETAAHSTKFSGLDLESDGRGNTIITVKDDGTQFKLVGFDPNEIKASFFDF